VHAERGDREIVPQNTVVPQRQVDLACGEMELVYREVDVRRGDDDLGCSRDRWGCVLLGRVTPNVER
jgi:hypothetical protein